MFARGLSFVPSCSCWIAALAVVCSPTQLIAQYDEPREYMPSEVRFLNVGLFQRDFRPRSSNPTSDSASIDFKRMMPVIGLRQGPVDITLGYTTYPLRGRSRSTVFLSALLSQDIPISGRRPSVLVMPLAVSADYTKAEGIGPERENFNIASIGLGIGLKYRYYASNLEFALSALEAASYSNEGLSIGSGFSALTLGDVTLVLRDALMLDGIALGYRFRYQTWSMNETRFNYASLSHGPFIGVLF